ncbi:MAG: thiol peroxidase [Spirochaetes bacterium]|nr:thiol peroxidase [Spirochaetota bacterium]
MAQITLKGNAIQTIGNLPSVGSTAPDFLLTKEDLSDVHLADFAGKKKVLNIFPSLDTGVCALSIKKWNEKIQVRQDAVVLNISNDTPFAHKRFCAEFSIKNAVALANFRRSGKEFGKDYGVTITTGGLAGALSRCIVVLDAQNKVLYTEQVPEITQEPDYDKALAAL